MASPDTSQALLASLLFIGAGLLLIWKRWSLSRLYCFSFFFVGLALGLRVGEAVGLRWQDVDLGRGEISLRTQVERVDGEVRFVGLKTVESEAIVYLTPAHVASLRAQRKAVAGERLQMGSEWNDYDLVFPNQRGGPLDPGSLRRFLHRICDRADVRKLRLHDLRSTAASLLVDADVHPAVTSAVMRHRSYTTTHQFYVEPSEEAQREAVRRLGKGFR